MAKGSTTPVSQTTTTQLSPAQNSLLDISLQNLMKFANAGPVVPGKSFVAGFNPAQEMGQNMALGAAGAGGPLQSLAASGLGASNFLTSGDVLHPESNPALKAYMNAAAQPITDQLLEQQLPAVRSGAAGAGQFGGTRQGIAEGLATGKASQAIGATTANIANQGYNAGLGAFTQGLNLLPQTMQAELFPSLVTSGVGDVRRGLEQAQLSEEAQRWNYQNLFPLLIGQQYANILAGLPGASTTTTATGPQPNPFMQMIGAGGSLLPLLTLL